MAPRIHTFGLIALLIASGATAAPLHAAEKPKVLLVCAEPAAMPRTGKAADGTPQGVDLALAEALATAMGRKLEIHWCASRNCSRACLREGRCDVILGHPQESDGPKDIAWSVPYAGAQFGLVVTKDATGIRSLADLRDKRVGIVAGTIALSEKDHQVGHFKTREDLLTQFAAQKLEAAFVDLDFASWYLHHHADLKLQLVKDYVPREHWNMSLAVRAKDAALLVEINKALAELAESGKIKKAYADQGVAYRPPFTGEACKPIAFNTWKRIQDRGVMAVSVDPDNLPYSSKKDDRPGFDVELLRELAKEMGVKLRIDWLDVHRATAVGKLLDRESDLAVGTPIDPNAFEDDDELAGKLLYSRPYYGTGYLLVQRKGAPAVKSLADLKGEKSRRLGAEAGSLADYRLRQRGYLRTLHRNQIATLRALHNKEIDYAYLWANVAWSLRTTPDIAAEVVPGFVMEDHWNIAIAMRSGDEDLKKKVDAALEKLIESGAVKKMLARYEMPYFAPFPEKKDKDENKEEGNKSDSSPLSAGEKAETVIRHPVANRGLEPQVQRVQTSKNPYGGLERVKSAGVLVVGLDQGNLPFSAANPAPAGLDHDIAQLLAGKLGVSLKIYWAYSAHDAYPSKLATKKLCDVMLNVMPDARFGNRVLFTKPYYLASYRLVVCADATTPTSFAELGKEPVAMEQGVVVRGLPDGTVTQSYPGLAEILDAVASNRIKAGYVIGTRGAWLAEKKHAGKLKFLDGAAVDRFPICAAVRKGEGDLKAALERAFDELAASGELAKVFARWHVPYVGSETDAKSSK
jgi:polar amino acid transport system substrate-binding protein